MNATTRWLRLSSASGSGLGCTGAEQRDEALARVCAHYGTEYGRRLSPQDTTPLLVIKGGPNSTWCSTAKLLAHHGPSARRGRRHQRKPPAALLLALLPLPPLPQEQVPLVLLLAGEAARAGGEGRHTQRRSPAGQRGRCCCSWSSASQQESRPVSGARKEWASTSHDPLLTCQAHAVAASLCFLLPE